MTGDLYQVRNLVKDYGTGDLRTRVLKDLSFDLTKGEFVALEGPSGSGKSTLLSILGTLLEPTSGTLEMLNQNLVHLDEQKLTSFRNRHIGFVFQFHHLLPDFTAMENVLFPAAASEGGETRVMRDRANQLLDRVGLSDRRDFRTPKLSGGQKQRVAIARALMNRPALVLADEPTGNLDRQTADQVLALLRDMNREDQTTFLISTHDQHVAAVCDRKMLVVDGRLQPAAEPAASDNSSE
ncbi:MAG: ABC transporter ATP-binding protein [Alphaproteobacteria bacterium]|nr:ABC transporter ATP-binding protein [Alphaproteobacteria bacterium]